VCLRFKYSSTGAAHGQAAHGRHPDAIFLAHGKGRAGHESCPGSQRPRNFRGPKGKTPAFVEGEVQKLLDAIEASTNTGLRDRALLGVLAYTFARIGAAVTLKVEDLTLSPRPGSHAADETLTTDGPVVVIGANGSGKTRLGNCRFPEPARSSVSYKCRGRKIVFPCLNWAANATSVTEIDREGAPTPLRIARYK
jgi:hypothetical protein